LPYFVKGALPQIKSKGKHIGLAAESQLSLFVPLPRKLERETQAALDAAAGVDAFLDRDFVWRAFENKTAGAGIEPFVVLADHDKIDVRRAFVLERAKTFIV